MDRHRLPLARSLRPLSFSQIHGHQQLIKALVKTLSPLKHHAYLLVGERGLGKTTIGRLIAQMLLCPESDENDSCGQCSVCQQIQQNRHPDVLEVDAASHSKVEETREIISQCALAPLHSQYKIYLIDEVHMLSTHSFNALLKTLEEPPEHIIFILATTHEEKIPSTVRSRCLKFFLNQPSPQELLEYLKNFCHQKEIAYDEQILQVIVDQADGSYRDLLNIVEYALALGDSEQLRYQGLLQIFSHLGTEIFENLVKALLQSNLEQLRSTLNTIFAKEEFNPKKFVVQFLQYLARQDSFSHSTPGLYTEVSKILTTLDQHPDPRTFVSMSFLRLSLLIAKKKSRKLQQTVTHSS